MKTKFTSILVSLFFVTSSSFAQLELFDQVYLWYPFNGDCNDYSGNDLHAVGQNLTSATGYDSTLDGCFFHNGTTSRINRPHLELGDTLTLSGWFYSTNDLQNSNLIYNGNSGFNGYGLFIKKAFTTYGLGNQIVVVQGGLSQDILDTSYHLPLFEWTHIAFVVRKNDFELYINGEFKGSGTRPFNTPDGTFSVGMNPEQQAGGFPAFFGMIDEVAIFKKGLDAPTVLRLFNEGVTTVTSNLIKGETMDIFPNPSKPSTVSVSIKKPGITNVEVYNSAGVRVLTHNLSGPSEGSIIKLNTSELTSGIYSLVVNSFGNKTTKRVVIQ